MNILIGDTNPSEIENMVSITKRKKNCVPECKYSDVIDAVMQILL